MTTASEEERMGLFGRGKAASPAEEPGRTAAAPAVGVRNQRVREALSVWAQRKDEQVFADVLRRAATGELLLDITDSTIADPGRGLQQGDAIAIAEQRDVAGKRLLMAFTADEELTAYRGRPGVSLVQPAAAVLAQACRDHEGLVIDGRAAGAFIAYAAEIEQHLAGNPEGVGRLGEATATRSMPFPEYLAALAEAPVFVPFEVQHDDAGAETGRTVPGVQDAQGRTWSVLGTAPAELWAWQPRVGAHRTRVATVARVVLEDGHAGVVVDPAEPSVTIPAELLRGLAG